MGFEQTELSQQRLVERDAERGRDIADAGAIDVMPKGDDVLTCDDRLGDPALHAPEQAHRGDILRFDLQHRTGLWFLFFFVRLRRRGAPGRGVGRIVVGFFVARFVIRRLAEQDADDVFQFFASRPDDMPSRPSTIARSMKGLAQKLAFTVW